ncbi:MAG: hypothetical protein ACK47M_14540 [Caldilinea sp.]
MSDTVNLHDEIPEEFASLVEAGEFWDTHDSGAYEDTMTPMDIELDVLDHKVYVAVARDVAVQLTTGKGARSRCQDRDAGQFVAVGKAASAPGIVIGLVERSELPLAA